MDNYKKPQRQKLLINPANRKATKNARKESLILDSVKMKKSLSGLRKSGKAK